MTTSPTRSASAPAPLVGLLAAFAAVYFIWGSTYLGIRIAIETIPPFTMAGVRFLSAGVLLYGGMRLTGAGRPTTPQWRSAAIVGVLLLVTGNGFLTWAEQYVASGVAALLVATVPLWIVVVDALAPGGRRPGLAVVSGLILGLFGIVILIGPQELGGERVHLRGAMVICVASFSWALGSIYSRRAPQCSSTLQNVGMQMLVGGVILLFGGYGLGERIDVAVISGRSAWALLYLSIIGGIVSYSAYVWLLKVSTPARVSTYAFVNPVVAVLLGWAVAGEALGTRVLLATVAVVVAVVLITAARTRGES